MGYLTSKLKLILLACVMCCCVVGCKNAFHNPLADWNELSFEPAEKALVLQQAATSSCVWTVAHDAGDRLITIQRTTPYVSKERQIQLQTEDGLLVGVDNGEWGGSLKLVDATGVQTKHLLDANVLRLVQSQSGVFVLTGNVGLDEGAIWLFGKRNDGVWSIRKVADLGGAPRVMSSENGDVLAAGAHGVYRLDHALNLTTMTLPFSQTFPNSISEDVSGKIYVGMNAFVVRLVPTKTGYSREWFTKPGCLP